jgi:hypothetical protein
VKNRLTILGLAFLICIGNGAARSKRVNQIPSGTKFSCLNCHTGSGGPRNAFGQAIQNGFLTVPGAEGNVIWGNALAILDADGDGFTNGTELQDPDGIWTSGGPAPGDPASVTLPGDPASRPTSDISEHFPPTSPEGLVLLGNFPNPFNASTRIRIQAGQNEIVRIRIFDLRGVCVRELFTVSRGSKDTDVEWNGLDAQGRQVPSGPLILLAESLKEAVKGKLLIIK